MSAHLQIDLDDLHRHLLSMCAKVEDLIYRAVAQLSNPSMDDARALTDQDNEIDRWDVEIEDKCLKILALHQPVAIDLRRITTVLKISGELERVADLAVNIVERAVGLLDAPELQIPDKLVDMAQAAVDMLHRSIDAYVTLDTQLARKVCRDDDLIDQANAAMIKHLIEQMHRQPDRLDALLHLFSAVRQVERVADHATNTAEDVVYLVEGKIIRHWKSLDRDDLRDAM